MWYLYLNINLNWFFIVRWWIEKISHTYIFYYCRFNNTDASFSGVTTQRKLLSLVTVVSFIMIYFTHKI